VLTLLKQTKSELSILSNMHGSARYIAFIQKIGDVLRLTDCDPLTVYLGGLDHRGTDGPFVYSWRAEFMQGTSTQGSVILNIKTNRHTFTSLFSRTAWVSQHQKGYNQSGF